MRNLLAFLLKNSHWWWFLLLVLTSLALMFRGNTYPASVYLSSANRLTASVLTASSSVSDYIGLKTENEQLLEQMAFLENEIQELRAYITQHIDTAEVSKSFLHPIQASQYQFLQANVVNSSVANVNNYITLDKGRLQGVELDMGVISSSGAVGVVSAVSANYSIVIPILHSKSRLSCKVVNNDHFGPLLWDGYHPAYAWLANQPRHVKYAVGDTVVTSGFSAIFPPGIIIGTVVGDKKESNDNFTSIQVALSTNFYTLKNVVLVRNTKQKEQLDLQKKISN